MLFLVLVGLLTRKSRSPTKLDMIRERGHPTYLTRMWLDGMAYCPNLGRLDKTQKRRQYQELFVVDREP